MSNETAEKEDRRQIKHHKSSPKAEAKLGPKHPENFDPASFTATSTRTQKL